MQQWRVGYSKQTAHHLSYSVGGALLVEAKNASDAATLAAYHLCQLPTELEVVDAYSTAIRMTAPDGTRYSIYQPTRHEVELPPGKVIGAVR